MGRVAELTSRFGEPGKAHKAIDDLAARLLTAV
jgi:type I restriction enzyme R subunit